MPITIRIDGQELESAKCDRCGCRLWPVSLMASHERRHKLLDNRLAINGEVILDNLERHKLITVRRHARASVNYYDQRFEQPTHPEGSDREPAQE